MPISIAVFDDNHDWRNSLQILIDQTEDMFCVGKFSGCQDVIADVEACAPRIVLMDIEMPNVNGIEGLRLLRSQFNDLCVIMLTAYEDDDKIVSAISAGANGYILKKTHPFKIMEGIRQIWEGSAPMTPSIAKRILELFQGTVIKKARPPCYLTEKEKEILNEFVKGYSYKMIAADHTLSALSINAHICNVYKKMQVKNIAAAVTKAVS